MGKPKAPPPPDYSGLAAQQGQESRETAQFNAGINRANQVTPWGSVSWTLRPGADPNNPQPGDYIQTTTLDPAQQQLLEGQNRISQSVLDTAQSGVDRVAQAMSTPFNMSGVPQLQSGAWGGFSAQPDTPFRQIGTTGATGLGQTAGIQQGIGSTALQGQIGQQSLQRGIGPTQAVQGQIDTQGLTAMPTAGEEGRRRVEEAIYSRLDPQFARQEEGLRTRLANQGIEVGTEAYNREIGNLNQARNDARMQAVLAGGAEQSRQVGLEQGLRAQGFGERQTLGQFANQAAAQQLQAGLARGQFSNDAAMQAYQQALASGQFANQAAGQQFQQGLAQGQFANQAAAQDFQQALARGQFGNQSLQQQFQQNLAAGAFGNEAAQQQFQQQMARDQIVNDFMLRNAQFGNQARQQAIQEQAYLRQLPLNELNALRTGALVQQPSFGGYYTPEAQPSPVFDAGLAQGQYDLGRYQSRQGGFNSLLGGLANLGSAWIMS